VTSRVLAVTSAPLPVAVTVMRAVPGLTAAITPRPSTLATAEVLDVYAYATDTWAPAVVTVAMSVAESPAQSARLSGETESADSASGGADTTTATLDWRVVAANPVPVPVAVTVMAALPGPTAEMTPALLTVTTDDALDE
jgi:hypothetical protein